MNTSWAISCTPEEAIALVNSWESTPPTEEDIIHLSSILSSRMSQLLRKSPSEAVLIATARVKLLENVPKVWGAAPSLSDMEAAMRTRLLIFRMVGPVPEQPLLSVERVKEWALISDLPGARDLSDALASSDPEERKSAAMTLLKLRILHRYYQLTGEQPDDQSADSLALLQQLSEHSPLE
jgi:hypothetical protein